MGVSGALPLNKISPEHYKNKKISYNASTLLTIKFFEVFILSVCKVMSSIDFSKVFSLS